MDLRTRVQGETVREGAGTRTVDENMLALGALQNRARGMFAISAVVE
jgi:hypothetical protein